MLQTAQHRKSIIRSNNTIPRTAKPTRASDDICTLFCSATPTTSMPVNVKIESVGIGKKQQIKTKTLKGDHLQSTYYFTIFYNEGVFFKKFQNVSYKTKKNVFFLCKKNEFKK